MVRGGGLPNNSSQYTKPATVVFERSLNCCITYQK